MGIPRKTIQYRHEVIGLSIDEIPDFKPKPRIERFGDKRMVFAPSENSTDKKFDDEELKHIIEYPRVPDFRFDSDDDESTEQEKKEYAEWIENAPEILIKRELFLNENELEDLIAGEKEIYFFASPFHEEKKQKAEAAIKIIRDIAIERKINVE